MDDNNNNNNNNNIIIIKATAQVRKKSASGWRASLKNVVA